MGWKSFKEYFNITHNVHIGKDKLNIGSPMCSDLVIIDINTGKIIKDGIISGFLQEYYPKILEVSEDKILDLINKEDSFENSLTVYTFKDDQIIEKKADKYGYPNITHDGELMYDNTFFKTYDEALNKAISEMEAGIDILTRTVEDKEKSLKESKDWLEKEKQFLINLKKQKNS